MGLPLIVFAAGIASMLGYTFFTILLPMMREVRPDSMLNDLYLGLHIAWVVFLLFSFLFNYAMCVMVRPEGPHKQRVLRELAAATGFDYPETPVEVALFRNDYEDKIILTKLKGVIFIILENLPNSDIFIILENLPNDAVFII